MKIYIENYPLEKISKKRSFLTDYLVNKKEYIQVFSQEGIFIINMNQENSIDQINVVKEEPAVVTKNYYENYHVWVDHSEIKKEKVYQIPFHHVYEPTIIFCYSLHKKSPIQLMIQAQATCKNNLLDHSESLLITDFYFEILGENNINSPMIKENLIEFLSLLN